MVAATGQGSCQRHDCAGRQWMSAALVLHQARLHALALDAATVQARRGLRAAMAQSTAT